MQGEGSYPGTVSTPKTLNVKIPAGVTEGQKIRLAGQGGSRSGMGGTSDLYLKVKIRPHRLYKLDGRDLSVDLPVTPWEAALGARVPVPTPGGAVHMTIPPGSQSN